MLVITGCVMGVSNVSDGTQEFSDGGDALSDHRDNNAM